MPGRCRRACSRRSLRASTSQGPRARCKAYGQQCLRRLQRAATRSYERHRPSGKGCPVIVRTRRLSCPFSPSVPLFTPHSRTDHRRLRHFSALCGSNTARKPIAWGTVRKLGVRRARWRYRLGDPTCRARKFAISLYHRGRATFGVGFCPQTNYAHLRE